ncbi:MAG TPA: enoyl-CoA hydratase-related protein [Terriglobales bacterium]|nr:enoyl-CoA hydratase-related protein [Terriglobales bacterium]
MASVEVERSGAVAHVWLNRPERHNALTVELGGDLIREFDSLGRDPAVRVIVLGGRGRSFCAGADLGEMKAATAAPFERALADAQRLARLFAAIADCPRPVVGRIHGHVLGGGMGLLCACDITVASEDTRFGFPEVRIGILPAVISPYVLRRIGDRNARELILTGERFGSDVALRVGLVEHVTSGALLDAAVQERVDELLEGSPDAQRRIKSLLARWSDTSFAEYSAGLPRALAEARGSDEAREGLAAFLEKRRPRWQG